MDRDLALAKLAVPIWFMSPANECVTGARIAHTVHAQVRIF